MAAAQVGEALVGEALAQVVEELARVVAPAVEALALAAPVRVVLWVCRHRHRRRWRTNYPPATSAQPVVKHDLWVWLYS